MSGHRHAEPTGDPVVRALARAAGVLPDQGPIGVFIHHNTLHAYQHLPFHEGVQQGAEALGARPYLSLAEFRSALASGRIDDADVRAEIDRALVTRGDPNVWPGLTRAQLWHTLMTTPCDVDDAPGLSYTIELGSAAQCKDMALWHSCVARLERGPRPEWPDERQFKRHRDCLVALGEEDSDVAVHGEMIRLGSGYLDHGQAHAALPGRARGFLAAVSALYALGGPAPRACPGVDRDMREVAAGHDDARAIIGRVLGALGVPDHEIESFVFATALALPGWSGMFSRLERHPDEHDAESAPRLADFIAVRLLLERRAIERLCQRRTVPVDWSALRACVPPPSPRPLLLDAAILWWISHRAGFSSDRVTSLSDTELRHLWAEHERFPPVLRRQVLHEAYERTYRRIILDAIWARRCLGLVPPTERPRAQFVFCIDEREESIRRAVEEQHPLYVTFGAAGFFGVAMDYRGLYDPEPAAYCPVVVTPAHEVHERPLHTDRDWHHLRVRLRDTWHTVERRAMAGSRTLSGGAGLSFLLGPVSVLRTLMLVLAPRAFSIVGNRIKTRMAPRPTTRLSALRPGNVLSPVVAEHSPRAESFSGKPVGFTLDEAIDRVTASLRNIGLVDNFAPIVVFLGHGSTSLNNPHESAHDCGACGGRRGGANARLFADMANRPDVRDGVRQRGVAIPADVWFVGALHDTADDSVKYYDLDSVPASHREAFEHAYAVLEQARRENALERSRRFDDAPLDETAEAALAHVESRSTLLAQPRPEYGHCTNSIAIVGRRWLSRGLHLDRRAFLVSYDATTDPDDTIIERILAAVGPVGAGISLEYYFSSVDNETFGCGTKLPHNVTGLFGVMNGHQSDLRTGLPLQMVEIHEPMRLLLIVEARPAALLTVASKQPEVAELVGKAWVQLVSLDPATGAMAVFQDGTFVEYDPRPIQLPEVDRSSQWHLRTRAHLAPALVKSAMRGAGVSAEAAREPVGAGSA